MEENSLPRSSTGTEQDDFAQATAQIRDDFDRLLNFGDSRTSAGGQDEESILEGGVDRRENNERDDGQGEEDDGDNHHHDDEDDDFTFVCPAEDDWSIEADGIFENGQIRPIFPLFNQDLVFAGDDHDDPLPIRPPVDKVFIESPRVPAVSPESEGINGVAAGPYCSWSKESSPDICKKSNSTGFSKLWRLKEKVHRSHSDGRDAFVFLSGPASNKREKKSVPEIDRSSGKPVAAAGVRSSERKPDAGPSSEKKSAGQAKVNGAGGKAKKGKATPLSAHEAYLRSRGAAEEDRRRSYLPYRQELVMGFFTNVNGGLSRNVHPF